MASEGFKLSKWAEGRYRELPKYCMFFYNMLLDPHIRDEFKEQAFATLWYILEGGDIIPPEDENLDGLDEVAFAFRCLTELVGRLPDAQLAIYEEVLHRDGVPLRQRVREAREHLGRFADAVSALYRDRIAKRAVSFKNAVQTKRIVEDLRVALGAPMPPAWSQDRLEHVETFLESFALDAQGRPSVPTTKQQPVAKIEPAPKVEAKAQS
jgi:hypothetical protein